MLFSVLAQKIAIGTAISFSFQIAQFITVLHIIIPDFTPDRWGHSKESM